MVFLRAFTSTIGQSARRFLLEGLAGKGNVTTQLKPKLPNNLKIKINGKDVQPNQVAIPEQPLWLQFLVGKSRGPDFMGMFRRVYKHNNPQNFFNPLRRSKRVIPFYALVGFVTYAGNQNDEHESYEFDYIGRNLLDGIKESLDIYNYPSKSSPTDDDNSGSQLDDFDLGSYLSKGCNAAVYEATLKTDECDSFGDDDVSVISNVDSNSSLTIDSETECVECVDDGDSYVIMDSDEDDSMIFIDTDDEYSIISETEIQQRDGSIQTDGEVEDTFLETWTPFPCSDDLAAKQKFAIKIMFNMLSSNDGVILQQMHNELLPCPDIEEAASVLDALGLNWKHVKRKVRMKAHANIVRMHGWFIDEMPDVDRDDNFPAVLPPRLNPDGLGHNKTLFIIMDKYDCTLQDAKLASIPIGMMVLTQLVEAIVHLNMEGIVHRDMKSNNILLKYPSQRDSLLPETGSVNYEGCPSLVLCDFGLALVADNMTLPYYTSEISKGGNSTLWAPEIACAVAGRGVSLNYKKSDIWAVGAMAYEIFGMANPFYRKSWADPCLQSGTYREEQLPQLPVEVPWHVVALIKCMLRIDPKKRPSAQTVGDCLHMLLWAPHEWLVSLLSGNGKMPCRVLINRWILLLATEVIMNGSSQQGQGRGYYGDGQQQQVEIELKRTFLLRFDIDSFMESVAFLWGLNPGV